MDHGHMDHGHGGMGHGGMDHDMGQCSMNMLFTWSTENLCIVFPQWRVDGTVSLILSLFLVAALTAGYEAIRDAARRYDARIELRSGESPSLNPPALSAPATSLPHGEDAGDEQQRSTAGVDVPPPDDGESSSLLGRPVVSMAPRDDPSRRLTRAAFYAVQVFYSFFIMLLFMTYNGWVMLAVAAGAFAGHLFFAPANEGAAKTVACH